MSDVDQQEREALAAVDDALRTFPIASPPPRLFPAIMARVRASEPPRFRPSWIDYAASLVLALAIGLPWLLWRWLSTELIAAPPWTDMLPATPPLLAVALVGGTALAAVLLAAARTLLSDDGAGGRQ
jgi:hypothetical protein